jgi:hypothetical protein
MRKNICKLCREALKKHRIDDNAINEVVEILMSDPEMCRKLLRDTVSLFINNIHLEKASAEKMRRFYPDLRIWLPYPSDFVQF